MNLVIQLKIIKQLNLTNYKQSIVERNDFNLSMEHVAISSRRIQELIKLSSTPFSLRLISQNPYRHHNIGYTILDGSGIFGLYVYEDIENNEGPTLRIYDIFKIYGDELFDIARRKRVIVVINHKNDHVYVMYNKLFEQPN